MSQEIMKAVAASKGELALVTVMMPSRLDPGLVPFQDLLPSRGAQIH